MITAPAFFKRSTTVEFRVAAGVPARECGQPCAVAPLRVHLVGGGERLALMYTEEGARTLSLRVFNCHERLFDELAASDFSIGEKLWKLDDGQRGEFMSWSGLCRGRLDASKRCDGKCKSARAGGVLQKSSTIEIHVLLPVGSLFTPIGTTFPNWVGAKFQNAPPPLG
jgi:hypothetical protein